MSRAAASCSACCCFRFWIVLAVAASTLLQKAGPSRNFVIVDYQGGYSQVFAKSVARARDAKTLSDLSDFAEKWHVDLPKLRASAPEVAEMIEAPRRSSSIDTFIAQGGLDPAFDTIKPYLGTGWTSFTPGKAPFTLVPTPDDLARASDVGAVAALYFKGIYTVDNGRLESVLVIPKGFDSGNVPARYLTGSMEDNVLPNFIREVLSNELRLRAVSHIVGDNAAIAPAMHLNADIEASDPTQKKSSPIAAIITRVAPIGFAFLLFFATFSNSAALLTGVIEEKSTRMVEILMSCASPREIMTGKLLGAIGASLTTLIIWAAGLLAAALVLAPKEIVHLALSSAHVFMTAENLPFVFIYFMCGLLIYGSIYLGIGSMAASITDAQALLGPASLIIFLPNILVGVIMADPNGLLARVVSWIPIYTPFYMLMRLSSHPAPWEIWATSALTLATTVFLLFRMGRVFANHLLTTERPPAFGAMIKGVMSRFRGRRAKSA